MLQYSPTQIFIDTNTRHRNTSTIIYLTMNVTKGNTLRARSSEQQSLFSGIRMRLSSGGTAGPSSAVRGGYVSSSAGGGGRSLSSAQASSARAASSTAASARAASSTAAWSQDSFGGDASSPLTRSPTRLSRAAEKDRLIASLELERDALLERCTDYERMVRELKLEINKLVVRAHNKKDLHKNSIGMVSTLRIRMG